MSPGTARIVSITAFVQACLAPGSLVLAIGVHGR